VQQLALEALAPGPIWEPGLAVISGGHHDFSRLAPSPARGDGPSRGAAIDPLHLDSVLDPMPFSDPPQVRSEVLSIDPAAGAARDRRTSHR